MNLKRRAVAPDLDGLNLAYPLDRDSGAEAFVLGAEPRAIAAESAGEQAQVVWSREQPVALRLVSSFGNKSKVFHDVLSVRERTDERWPDQRTAVDEYSFHYCMYVEGQPVGALGVTRALQGEVFMQSYYPEQLFAAYLDRIVSAYRFRLLPEFRRTATILRGVNIALVMTREAWREQISHGAGLDVINVEKSYIPYYERMGYVLVNGYDFICPIFHQPISVMLLPTDPNRKSVLQDLVQGRSDSLILADVMRCFDEEAPRHGNVANY